MKWLLIISSWNCDGTNCYMLNMNYIKSFQTQAECSRIGKELAPKQPVIASGPAWHCVEEKE